MANKCVMNMAKRHRADVKGLQQEANREHDDATKYKGEVDLAKSVDNAFLVKSDDWNKSVDDTLSKYGVKESRNSVVLVTSVYTASPEWFKEHPEQTARDYFEACLEYERRTKGEVISAVIHYDETTPHMHVATVPVVEVQDEVCVPVVMKDADGNDMTDDMGDPIYERYASGKSAGKVKYRREKAVDDAGNPITHVGLSAKQVFGNRVAMSRRQTEFFEECGKPFGMERGEIRVETTKDAREHLTEAKFRAKVIARNADDKAQRIVAQAEKDAEALEERSERVLRGAKREAQQIVADAKKSAQIEREGLTRASEEIARAREELNAREAQIERRELEIMRAPIYATKRVIEVAKRSKAYKDTPDGNALGRFKMFIERYGDRITEQIQRDSEQRRQRVESLGVQRVHGSDGYEKE